MKTEIIRLIIEIAGVALLAFLSAKTFKYKDALVKLIESAQDGKVTEDEFQGIVDEVKKEIY